MLLVLLVVTLARFASLLFLRPWFAWAVYRRMLSNRFVMVHRSSHIGSSDASGLEVVATF
jgi:hypothetical protein